MPATAREAFANSVAGHGLVPTEKSYGGAIAHVITHSMPHRAQLLSMLRKRGVESLPEGDVLSWEERKEAGHE
jgi:uncharacterized damage-inducible protein DinB